MKIAAIEAQPIQIPFRTVFRHASARYRGSEGVLVHVQSRCGLRGYGEGCPRRFVTGESVSGAVNFVKRHAKSLVEDVIDMASLRVWRHRNRADIAANPAAWCAVELALLDTIGRERGEGLEALLDLPPLRPEFQYSAVLGDSIWPVHYWQFYRYRWNGFRDFKIKLSGNPARNRWKVAAFRNNRGLRLRGDANNLWSDADACLGALGPLEFDWFALEEPVRAGDFGGARRVSQALGVPIVLDESFTDTQVLNELEHDPARWIVNLRVSKLGGLLNTLDIVRECQDRGIAMIVGAHVGETSILSRAGMTVANAIGDTLLAQEGAFGTHLLRHDIARTPVMFGRAGKLRADRSHAAPGNGLEIETAAIP